MVVVLLECGHRRDLPVLALKPLKSTGKPLEKIYCPICGGNHRYTVEEVIKVGDKAWYICLDCEEISELEVYEAEEFFEKHWGHKVIMSRYGDDGVLRAFAMGQQTKDKKDAE